MDTTPHADFAIHRKINVSSGLYMACMPPYLAVMTGKDL